MKFGKLSKIGALKLEKKNKCSNNFEKKGKIIS